MATVEINGHQVPEHKADLFIDGETGEPITDAEYDEQKARLAELEADPDAVTWEVLATDETPEGAQS